MITITNSSPAFHRFYYRELGRMQASHVEIPSGHQEQIGKRWGVDEINHVVSQLERAGARRRTDSMKDVSFRGLVYSVDRPLSEEEIREAASHDMQARETTSAQESIKAAAVYDAAVNPNGEKRKAKSTGVSIRELESINSKKDDRKKGGINMDLSVAENGGPLVMPK